MSIFWPPAVETTSPLELVETEIVQRLRTDPYLTTLVDGRVYTAIPPSATYPLVVIGTTSDMPWPRMRHDGVDALITVRASSQVRGNWEVHQIADRARGVLHGVTIEPLGPFRSARLTYASGAGVYQDDLAGLTTVHRPVLFRVRVTIA